MSGAVSRRLAAFASIATAAIATGVGACGANLPQLPAPQIANPGLATEVVGRPDEIYQRIARRAQRCWFGPFGSLHKRFMMHADVPPPTSSDPVTITIHRRLEDEKKPWGPAVLRLALVGRTTTTLEFTNVGLDAASRARMTAGLTEWANGRDDCGGEAEAGNGPLHTGATPRPTAAQGSGDGR